MKTNSELFMLLLVTAAITFILATITHIVAPAFFTPQLIVLLFIGVLAWFVAPPRFAPPRFAASRQTAQ